MADCFSFIRSLAAVFSLSLCLRPATASRNSFRDSSNSLNCGSSSSSVLSVSFLAISVARRVSRSFCLALSSVPASSSSLAREDKDSRSSCDSLASRKAFSFAKPAGIRAAEKSVSVFCSSGVLCSMRFFRESIWVLAVVSFCCSSVFRSLAFFSAFSASAMALFSLPSSSSGFLSPYNCFRSSVPSASSFLSCSRVSCFSVRALTCVSITASRRFTSLSIAAICFSMSVFCFNCSCHTFSLDLRDSSSTSTSTSGISLMPSGWSFPETVSLSSLNLVPSFVRASFNSASVFSAVFLSLAASVSSFSVSFRFLQAAVSACSSFLMAASCSSALSISLASDSIFCSISSGIGTLPSAKGWSVEPQSGQGLPSSSLARWSSSSSIFLIKAISRRRVSFSVRYSRSSLSPSNSLRASLPCCRFLPAVSSSCFLSPHCLEASSSFFVAFVTAVSALLRSVSFCVSSCCLARRLPSCSSTPASPPISHSSCAFSLRYSSAASNVFSAAIRFSCSFTRACLLFSIFPASLAQASAPSDTAFVCSVFF